MKNYQSGNGKHHGNRNYSRGKGAKGFCSCKNCGYTLDHQAGVPCKTIMCPNCKTPLLRTEIHPIESDLVQKNADQINPDKGEIKIEYPKVLDEKCTACGICMDACPMETIEMKYGKAFINIGNCSNCKICISICPVNAIILDKY